MEHVLSNMGEQCSNHLNTQQKNQCKDFLDASETLVEKLNDYLGGLETF